MYITLCYVCLPFFDLNKAGVQTCENPGAGSGREPPTNIQLAIIHYVCNMIHYVKIPACNRSSALLAPLLAASCKRLIAGWNINIMNNVANITNNSTQSSSLTAINCQH